MVAAVLDEEVPGAPCELVAGVGADEGGDDSEVGGDADMGTPADGVEENERENASFKEDEGEKDDDGEFSPASLDGVVERRGF